MRVISNNNIVQVVGSLQISRPVGSQFDLNDAEAQAAITAGHVRAFKPSITPSKPTETKVSGPTETK
jgi:hypothetical protein